MELIDKDALVAWAKETYLCENASMIRKVCYKQLLEHLDSLEAKEVDIDKEIGKFFGDDDWKASAFEEEQRDMIKFAKHFFELGLKAQKGEKIC